ncbi:MAG: HAMP domain-containing protein [Nitrospinae bacterium]|nr:HAMP domain-containing protein [Nitrospinota bacterium]
MSIEPGYFDGPSPLQTVNTIEGRNYVAARKIFFDPLRPDRFLTLIYALPHSAIGEHTSSTNFKIVAGAFVFTLAAAGAVIVILLWMFAPLQRITEAAVAIADGRYDTPLPAVRGGEIALLTSAFQLMVERVRRRERDLLTLNRELDQKVEERTAQLRAANLELSEFASVASHDLQEPLRTIVAFSERLRERHAAELSPKALDYLERISKGGERMSYLIRDILEYSRASNAAARRERVDLDRLFDNLLTDMKAALAESGGTVERGPLPVLAGSRTWFPTPSNTANR